MSTVCTGYEEWLTYAAVKIVSHIIFPLESSHSLKQLSHLLQKRETQRELRPTCESSHAELTVLQRCPNVVSYRTCLRACWACSMCALAVPHKSTASFAARSNKKQIPRLQFRRPLVPERPRITGYIEA